MKEYGSNFELSYTKGIGTGTELRDTGDHIYLRSAREALFLIAQNEKREGKKVVFMPALCCNSMIQAFVQLEYEIVFYRICNDLTIDYGYLSEVIRDDSLLLIMNYHGHISFKINEIITIIDGRNIKIIQDCTQQIFSDELKVDADYYIGSLRKWLPIPDGAFLSGSVSDIMRNDVVTTDEDPFVIEAFKGMQEKTEYLSTGRSELKKSYRQRNAFCMDYLKGTIVPNRMSDVSKEIVQNDLYIELIKKQRHENYMTLCNALKVKHGEILRLATNQSCPLCLPIIIENRDTVQRILAENNVFCQVLWPIPGYANQICRFSSWFSNHMLAVPCDQRYDIFDMQEIAKRIQKVLLEVR